MFQLADIWVPITDAEEYAEFLRKLRLAIANESIEPPKFHALDDLHFRPDVAGGETVKEDIKKGKHSGHGRRKAAIEAQQRRQAAIAIQSQKRALDAKRDMKQRKSAVVTVHEQYRVNKIRRERRKMQLEQQRAVQAISTRAPNFACHRRFVASDIRWQEQARSRPAPASRSHPDLLQRRCTFLPHSTQSSSLLSSPHPSLSSNYSARPPSSPANVYTHHRSAPSLARPRGLSSPNAAYLLSSTKSSSYVMPLEGFQSLPPRAADINHGNETDAMKPGAGPSVGPSTYLSVSVSMPRVGRPCSAAGCPLTCGTDCLARSHSALAKELKQSAMSIQTRPLALKDLVQVTGLDVSHLIKRDIIPQHQRSRTFDARNQHAQALRAVSLRNNAAQTNTFSRAV
mmetsp:Transcript_47276/g.94219  ORF Transcript_47276/g.94219 Transcript_47276/m.94219 type:complete len:399 (-) Transcript_47276:71-1267(-)|eukprot:CAMPEP_0174722306 /NCGR_PEP_ID=MMETSP1094-20130205/38150_1 /TAXON_ID=156173 /ORGANISM="Chrysochromulina brevifilum, Strain UTEX LB 985" /LENGTH=398 /DNA_ID=CAMNT_0015923139 /DNA_START=864 /DNA_END=2060 /DNA_ORIENTATION=-